MKSRRFDAIVVGGAVSGASCALRLARAGWSVAVVEKEAFPRRKVCGEFLSATNWRVIDELGIRPDVESLGGEPVSRVAVYAGDDIIEAPMPSLAGRPGIRGAAVARADLDARLLALASEHGAEVFQPARVTGCDSDDALRRVAVKTADGSKRELAAPVAVAAHGSWGASPLATFPDSRAARPSDLFGFKAHFRGGRLAAGLMPLFVFDGGYGGLVESSHGLLSLSCCVRRDRLARIRSGSSHRSPGEAVIEHLRRHVKGVARDLSGAETEGGVLSTGPIRPGIRPKWRDGFFRVGNAAGEAHPIIAEGISMALQSSWLLSDEWIRAGREADPRAVARRYARRWRRAFAPRIHASRVFAALAMNPAATHLARRVLQTAPPLVSAGAQLSGKTKVVVR